ncbi:hypothetical protein VP01_1012g4 [Puccinia sorghi]|uniref:RING-type domain-containing protein n=1 Tax=Puccinia sorghi TaxID=27349 RepID=A0A0L6VV79_9BASI|nr:hypothetical protein VP01_1012g4 [Puccinia sorghi]
MSCQVLILLVGRSVSMNCQPSSALLHRGNDPVMGIEGLPHLTDEEAGMASPRTVMPTSLTQSCLESSSHHQEGGSEPASISIDAAAGERKTGLDRAQSKKQAGEAQADVKLLNEARSIQMSRLGSRRPKPKECSICLTEMDPCEPSLIEAWPECGHEYHKECISQWSNPTCPNCRGIRSDRIEVLDQQPIHDQSVRLEMPHRHLMQYQTARLEVPHQNPMHRTDLIENHDPQYGNYLRLRLPLDIR